MKRLQVTREHAAVSQNSRTATRTASAGDPAGMFSKVKKYSAGAPAVRRWNSGSVYTARTE